jgi:hypothetical protein
VGSDGLDQAARHIAPSAPQVDTGNGKVVSGTGTPGSIVTVTDSAGQVVGSATVDAVAAADPLLEKVYERLDDYPAPQGVNGWFVDPQIRIRVEEGSTPIASVLLALNVTLATVAGGLTLST